MRRLLIIPFLSLLGCSTHPSIEYTDQKDISLNSVHWNEYTSQRIIADITSQMLKSSKFSKDKFYAFGHIRNDTLDHPDTKMLADSIVTILKNEGNLNFVAYKEDNPKHKIDGYCTGSLYGDMQHDSNQRIMDFILQIKCTNTKTDLRIWSGQTKKSNRLEKGW